MTDQLNRFYNSVENAAGQNQTSLVELFVYYLTVEAGYDCATPKQVSDCFAACDLTAPKNTSARLLEGLTTKPARYIKVNGGYKLQRHMREALSKKLGAEQVIAQTSSTLRGLEHRLPEGGAKNFLNETIDCFEAGANRATITMVWILTLDHLFAHILKHKLTDFNTALSKDQSVKLNAVTRRDDFAEMKETRFIEICRAAGIISKDVRKILDTSLGTRNSSAHPTGVTISKSKLIALVENLILNVVLKYDA